MRELFDLMKLPIVLGEQVIIVVAGTHWAGTGGSYF